MGTFQQFLVYLEKLSEQERLYNVDYIEMRPVSENTEEGDSIRSRRFQMLESRIVIETYRFNENISQGSVTPNPSSQGGTP